MAQGRKTSLVVIPTIKERYELESWQRSTTISSGLARRGRIILLLADGESISKISLIVGIRRRFIYKWTNRFLEKRIEGLYDKHGRGRKPFFPSRGSNSSCKTGLRKARQNGQKSFPMGLRRTQATTYQ